MHPPVEYITGHNKEWAGGATVAVIENTADQGEAQEVADAFFASASSSRGPETKSRPSSARQVQLSTPARTIPRRPRSTERDTAADKAKLEKDERRRKEKAGEHNYATGASAAVAARTTDDPSTPEPPRNESPHEFSDFVQFDKKTAMNFMCADVRYDDVKCFWLTKQIILCRTQVRASLQP